MGGDHLISYPILRAVASKFGPVALVHVDAHSDTAEHQVEHVQIKFKPV
jgi:arginase family enzyme